MRRYLLIATALCLVLLACFEAPLGSPGAGRIDARFNGLWVHQEKAGADYEAWLAVPIDDHVYCLVFTKFKFADGEPMAEDMPVFRAWITQVANSPFISFEPMPQLLPEYKDKRVYFSARLAFGKNGTLVAQPLSYEFKDLAHVKDAALLTRLVEQNIQDPKLFDDAQTFHRPDPANATEKKIQEYFLGTGKK